jgi:4-carboxymuconolactone decarboxylase
MIVKIVRAGLIALVGVAVGFAVAQAQAPAAGRGDGAPTLEQLERSVARLRGGRIPRPTSYAALTTDQKMFVNGILSGPRGDISGSLGVMMASPIFGDLAQRVIGYARFAGRDGYSSVPPKLSELAILMGARAWGAQYAWNAHHRYAVTQGLSADVVEAVRLGRRPSVMEPDVAIVFTFCAELLTRKEVSDATFAAARTLLGGDRGIVDLVGTLGAYQMVAMMMVVDQMPLPEGIAPHLQPVSELFAN